MKSLTYSVLAIVFAVIAILIILNVVLWKVPDAQMLWASFWGFLFCTFMAYLCFKQASAWNEACSEDYKGKRKGWRKG